MADSTCSVDGCDEPRVSSTSYCNSHRNAYQREWRRKRRIEELRLRSQLDREAREVSRETLGEVEILAWS